jgi:PAS domain S-box-containing protein
MKPKHITPTQNEKLMRENDFIVSKTDTKGRITYGNRIFMEFSGYSEEELLGTQHNIIRHPDMPRGVFKLLWDTLAQEQEIFAFVKNLAKDGSFYWVFANVTPSYDDQGKVDGYFSVRRKPNRKAVDIVSGLYAQMLEIERKAGPKNACQASIDFVVDFLTQKGTTYEKLVLELQA